MLNQDRADWIAEAPDDVMMIEMPAGPVGPLTKDFTGLLYA